MFQMLDLLFGAPAKRSSAPIRPHPIALVFGADIPRHWIPQKPLLTHLANSLGLIFPKGERFFVRSVRTFLDGIQDPQLRQAVHGFMGQEMHHALQHERFYDTLRAQGYQFDGFLKLYEKVAFDLIERHSPPKVRLATTAALEHFTAAFAQFAFREDFMAPAHPVMKDLFLWHAAEEIEHKNVAFDLLQAVDPSYALRLLGMAIAAPTLVGFWLLGGLTLLAQERDLSVPALLRDMAASTWHNEYAGNDLILAIATYMLPHFHPSLIHDGDAAEQYLAKLAG